MRRVAFLSLALLLASCSYTGDALRSAGAGATSPDAQILRDIAQASLAEIEAGKLALQKAQAEEVREFGQRMVDDHTLMLAEGTRIGKAKGMPVPREPDERHRAAAKKLEQMSGESFDRAYMEQMVKDHGETLELLERAFSEARDPDLRAHAQKGIPLVRQHLDMARRVAGDLEG